jgi:hypothetical protein
LVKAGKIRQIGVSNESPWGVCEYIKQSEMKGLPRIASIQNPYHLANRHYETSYLDEVCFRENVGLLAYSPFAFGQLTGKYLDNPQAHGRLTIFPAKLESALYTSRSCGSYPPIRRPCSGQWHDSNTNGAIVVLFTLVYCFNNYWCYQSGSTQGKH